MRQYAHDSVRILPFYTHVLVRERRDMIFADQRKMRQMAQIVDYSF